ncbi:hypothetical protein HY345_01160 [Candidatus Microgenomates bacterium]|nr:hypothetical protein [Candidatus Microgenomates bacterium]
MTITKYTAEIVENTLFSPIVRHLTLSLIDPREINFTAGQYATFIISPSARRSYSFCSNPRIKNIVELCTDNLPQGVGSSWWNKLHVHNQVEFLAPLGKFIVDINLEKEKIFIATGTGIAPIRSMILDLLENQKYKQPLRLFFGVRNEENKLFFEHFRQLEDKYPNFIFQPVISQPNGEWQGEKGRVNDLVSKTEPKSLNRSEFYLCGSHSMIVGIKEQLMTMDVNQEDVHFEQFY